MRMPLRTNQAKKLLHPWATDMSFKAPEPIILAVALLLLALAAAGLAYSFPSLSDITGITSLDPKGQPTKSIKAEELDASLTSWNSPDLWTQPTSKHPLFSSTDILFYPSLYPAGEYIKKDDGTATSPGGVLLTWYKQYGLDITSGSVDRDDPDGDGFSNIVEYKNEQVGERLKASDCDGSKSTNPLDAQSHPTYLSRLRLQEYETRPFHIQFKGYQQLNNVYVFQIYLNDVPSSNQPPLKKTGDSLGFEGYTVGEFKLNIVTKKNPNTGIEEQVDESTLELDKPEIGLKVVVPFRTIIDSPESTADFVMLMPSEVEKVIKVPRGKIFTAPYIPNTSFLVIAATDAGATIRDTKTKQDYHILKLDHAEWDQVPLPPAGAAVKTP